MVALLEIVFEYINNEEFIILIKPLLIPLLISIYCLESNKKSFIYITALVLNWLANVLFISTKVDYINLAALFFILQRIFMVYKIHLILKPLKWSLVLLGTIPFIFLFLCSINFIFIQLEGTPFYISLIQSIIMSFFGGLALSNYTMKNNTTSKLLLLSSIFFALNILIVGIRLYFLDFQILKPISMLFFILGHYIFYLFITKVEAKKFNL